METLKYLKPDNPIALGLVCALIGLFVLWVLYLTYLWLQHSLLRKQMKRSADVEILSEALQVRFFELDKTRDENSLPIAEQETPITSTGPGPIFRRFCQRKSLKEDGPLSRHIRTIFDAGWTESHLDVGQLIKHTTNNLFQGNNLMRSVLAVFIVMGLLGTLFGLADSLAQLVPAMTRSVSGQPNVELSMSLSGLLTHLKSAFAPSIWGVALTVLGVLLFSCYLRFGCSPLKVSLDYLTLTIWVPQLFPTTSQRLLKTFQHSIEQSHKSLEAAYKVAEFSEKIENEIRDFSPNLKRANKVLKSLSDSGTEIDRFAQAFTKGVSQLTSFQEEIRGLYQQMVGESKAFQDSVKESIDGSKAFHKNVAEILDNQNSEIQNILKALNCYEDAYVKERGLIDAKLQDVLSATKKAFDDIGERNRELVEELGKPLIGKLDEKLGDIENTLTVKLANILEHFNKIDIPIRDAAQKIAASLDNSDKHIEVLLIELKHEFFKQNEGSREQTKLISELSEKIVGVLAQLSENSQIQHSALDGLSGNIGRLAQDISYISLDTRTEPQIQTARTSERSVPLQDSSVSRRRLVLSKQGSNDSNKTSKSQGDTKSWLKKILSVWFGTKNS